MTAPYWQSSDGRLTVYHGDMLDVLQGLGAFDVAVTDAPFGIGHGKLGARKGGRNGDKRKIEVTAYHAPAKWDAEINPAWCSTVCGAAPVVGVAAPGARIIDPFMGSGSTLVAAQRLGFACVGIDASEEHCESAVVRLGGTGRRAAEPVGPLFGGPTREAAK